MSMQRIYLAGPMTGMPDHNFPAFHGEAARLRRLGYHVENPADHGIIPGAELADYLRLDLPLLVTCDTLALLPGWLASRGANIEHGLAVNLGMKIVMAADITEPARSAA